MTKITACIPAALLCAATATAQTTPAAPPQGQKFTLAQTLVRGHDNIQRNLVEAAEKMPEEHYGFKPTPEIRPFSQVLMHAAVSRFRACSFFSAKPNPREDVKEDQPRPKAEIVALLKEGGAYCSEAMKGQTDESMLALIPIGPNEVARGLMIAGENAHANEIYGTLAVYLRLKGLVPPSTERSQPKK